MHVFFDTNVYDCIDRAGQRSRVRDFLDSEGLRVRANRGNLFEVFAIRDRDLRRRQLQTLRTVAAEYQSVPDPYRHAMELRMEVGRCRPRWLRVPYFERPLKRLLHSVKEEWLDACRMKLPDPRAFEIYKRDFDGGIGTNRAAQTGIRRSRRENLRLHGGYMVGSGIRPIDVDVDDPEVYWRWESMSAWHGAMVQKLASTRDYADWLSPYVKADAFADPSYADFWLKEVDGRNLPRNRLMGLVSFYQPDHKITHGNPGDQLHATTLLDVDVFATADRRFFDVLSAITGKHELPRAARIVLVGNAAACADPVGELRRVL